VVDGRRHPMSIGIQLAIFGGAVVGALLGWLFTKRRI
jgi:F0F1-type ATP synthase assembly protein I